MSGKRRKSHRRAEDVTLRISRGMNVRQERIWGSLCHLAGFAALIAPFAGMVIGPLVCWLLRRDRSHFVDREGKKAVNFQLSVFVYLLLGLVLTRAYIGYAIVALLLGLDIVCIVAASIRANNGEDFEYPLCIQFVT